MDRAGDSAGMAGLGNFLVVDEDHGLRKSMGAFLQNAGFRVLEASNAYEGLYACVRERGDLRVLAVDLNLAPVGGLKLAENVLRVWPHVQVLCMAAGTDPAYLNYWLKYLNAEFLPKPFTFADLHQRVARLLGAETGDLPFAMAEAQAPGTQAAGHALFWDSRDYR